eukprot:scaffold23933_cov119-Isochrysis_galbana.AAC.10
MTERALCVWPHGLIGQSFEGDGAPLSGQQARRDCGAAVVRTSKRPPSSPSPNLTSPRLPGIPPCPQRRRRAG